MRGDGGGSCPLAMLVSFERDAAIAPRAAQGLWTPRQRPYRQGRYHRAPVGFVSGTLSMPDVPQG